MYDRNPCFPEKPEKPNNPLLAQALRIPDHSWLHSITMNVSRATTEFELINKGKGHYLERYFDHLIQNAAQDNNPYASHDLYHQLFEYTTAKCNTADKKTQLTLFISYIDSQISIYAKKRMQYFEEGNDLQMARVNNVLAILYLYLGASGYYNQEETDRFLKNSSELIKEVKIWEKEGLEGKPLKIEWELARDSIRRNWDARVISTQEAMTQLEQAVSSGDHLSRLSIVALLQKNIPLLEQERDELQQELMSTDDAIHATEEKRELSQKIAEINHAIEKCKKDIKENLFESFKQGVPDAGFIIGIGFMRQYLQDSLTLASNSQEDTTAIKNFLHQEIARLNQDIIAPEIDENYYSRLPLVPLYELYVSNNSNFNNDALAKKMCLDLEKAILYLAHATAQGHQAALPYLKLCYETLFSHVEKIPTGENRAIKQTLSHLKQSCSMMRRSALTERFRSIHIDLRKAFESKNWSLAIPILIGLDEHALTKHWLAQLAHVVTIDRATLQELAQAFMSYFTEESKNMTTLKQIESVIKILDAVLTQKNGLGLLLEPLLSANSSNESSASSSSSIILPQLKMQLTGLHHSLAIKKRLLEQAPASSASKTQQSSASSSNLTTFKPLSQTTSTTSASTAGKKSAP